MWPDPGMGPSEVFYAIGEMEYPGAPDYHLVFTQQWRVTEDTWTLRVAASPDGILWGFVPSDAEVVGRGEGRGWDAGAIEVGAGMVDLPGNRVGFPITGHNVPHKHPRSRGLGKIAWVSWPRDRVITLQADQHGQFTAKRVRLKGDKLRINVRTKHVGKVAVEVLGDDNEPLKGRTFADCDHISGDYMDKVVTWRGDPSLGRGPHEPLASRVKLSFGQLLSMRFG